MIDFAIWLRHTQKYPFRALLYKLLYVKYQSVIFRWDFTFFNPAVATWIMKLISKSFNSSSPIGSNFPLISLDIESVGIFATITPKKIEHRRRKLSEIYIYIGNDSFILRLSYRGSGRAQLKGRGCNSFWQGTVFRFFPARLRAARLLSKNSIKIWITVHKCSVANGAWLTSQA